MAFSYVMSTNGKGRPLLVETVPGERNRLDWVSIGQALAFLGSVAVILFVTISALAGPSLVSGWEGSWFLPRTDFGLACPVGLGMIFLGIIAYYYGRRQQRRMG